MLKFVLWSVATSALLFCHVTSAVAQVPAAPSDAIAYASRPGDLAITLFWSDNAIDEDGFEVERCIGDDFASFQTVYVSPYGNIGGFSDVGLAENTSYTYRVRAFNAAGSSEFSNVATAKTSYAQPRQVTNLAASFVDGQVHLSWVDVATNETRFEVERLEPGVSPQFEIVATLDPDTINFVDTTALNGTEYLYRVRPWRFDVFGGSADPVSVTTGPGLNAPVKVAARAKSAEKIELTWKGNYPKGTLIEIQRSDAYFGFLSTIDFACAKERKYVDEGLPSATYFVYRIRVITETAVSPWVTVDAITK